MPVDSNWGLESKAQQSDSQTQGQPQTQTQQGGLWGQPRSGYVHLPLFSSRKLTLSYSSMSQRTDSIASTNTSESQYANPQPQATGPKRWQPSDTFGA